MRHEEANTFQKIVRRRDNIQKLTSNQTYIRKQRKYCNNFIRDIIYHDTSLNESDHYRSMWMQEKQLLTDLKKEYDKLKGEKDNEVDVNVLTKHSGTVLKNNNSKDNQSNISNDQVSNIIS